MLLRDVPTVGLAIAFMLAPGIVWAMLAYPSPSRMIRFGQGLALGLAIQVTLAAPLSATVRITQVSVAIATLITLIAAVVLGMAMRVRAPRLKSQTVGRRFEAAGLGVIITTGVAICALPLAFWSVPDGWDPSAHSLLASVVIATGKLPTWQPFEPIVSNYPYGAHVLLADLGLLTGLAPDKVFGSLLNVFVPAMALPQIYALARRMWRRGSLALAAVGAYALLGFANSVAYGSWGGLPNALGLILLLALLEPLFAPGYTPRRVILAGFLLSATTLTHHHVTLTAALILGGYALALVALLFIWRGAPTSRGAVVRRGLGRVVSVCFLGMLLASYELAPYLIRGVRSLGRTEVFGDFHEYSGWPFDKNGAVLWIAAALGVAIILREVWRRAPASMRFGERIRQSLRLLMPRSPAGEAQLFSALALMILFVAFVFGQFIFKDIAWALYHKDMTAFSPLRFLSNMTYFLALYAAPSLSWLWNLAPSLMVRARPACSRVTALALRVGVIAGLLAVAVTSLRDSGQIGAHAGQLYPGDLAAFQWVRANTPAKTIVIELIPNDDKWAPYFTQREALYTPLPASEDTAGYVAEKRDIITAELAALNASPRLGMVALASEGSAWSALAGRPVAVIVNSAMPALGQPAFTAQTVRVYMTPSLVTLAPISGPLPRISLHWRSPSVGQPSTRWTTLEAGLAGWTRGAPDVAGPPGSRWLMIRFNGPLPAGAAAICMAQNGAQLWVDGVLDRTACDGRVTQIPALSAPGPHVIGVYIWKGVFSQPWADIMLLANAHDIPAQTLSGHAG